MKFVLLLYTIFSCTQLFAALPPNIKSGRIQLEYDLTYYSTDANYDNNGGSFEKISRGRGYSELSAIAKMHYSLSRESAIFGNIEYSRGESVNDDLDRLNSDITDVELGFQHRLKTRPVVITPEIVATIPLFTFEEDTDEAIISEGVEKAKLGVWLSKNFSGFHSYIYTGAEYRGGGRSALFHWDIGSHWRTGVVYLGAEVGGFASINDDEDINDPTARQTVVDQKNGGSFRYYSVNPEVLDADLWGGWRVGRGKIIRLGYNRSLNGKNFAAGSQVFLSFRMNIDTGPRDKKTKKIKKDSERFIPQSENYNEELFQDDLEKEANESKKEDRLIEDLTD